MGGGWGSDEEAVGRQGGEGCGVWLQRTAFCLFQCRRAQLRRVIEQRQPGRTHVTCTCRHAHVYARHACARASGRRLNTRNNSNHNKESVTVGLLQIFVAASDAAPVYRDQSPVSSCQSARPRASCTAACHTSHVTSHTSHVTNHKSIPPCVPLTCPRL